MNKKISVVVFLSSIQFASANIGGVLPLVIDTSNIAEADAEQIARPNAVSWSNNTCHIALAESITQDNLRVVFTNAIGNAFEYAVTQIDATHLDIALNPELPNGRYNLSIFSDTFLLREFSVVKGMLIIQF